MIVLNGGYYRLTIFRYIHCVLIFSINMNVKMMTMLNKNMFCILSISIKNKPYIQNKKCLNFSLRVRLPRGGVTFPLWKSDPGVNLPRGSVFDVTHHLLVLSIGCRLVATRGGEGVSVQSTMQFRSIQGQWPGVPQAGYTDKSAAHINLWLHPYHL